MRKRGLQFITVVMALLVLFTGSDLQPVAASIQLSPSIEETSCAAFADSGLSENWQCGYLSVPENRSNPQSRTIKVAFAILKATGGNPQADALVYLTGGPGDTAIGSGWDEWRTGSLKNRDFILVDPRGVGYSQPKMDCLPDTAPDASAQDKAPSIEESNVQTLQWAKSCREQLISEGFDLTAYNSTANANDLEELRLALGYKQWNLYGISYGTRTALYTMRLFPDGIRSVILDSVLPPQVDRIGGDLNTIAASFAALFAACKADSACNRDNPDLETKFHELIQRLDSEPMKISIPDEHTGKKKQVWVTSAGVINGLQDIMKRGYLLRLAPLAITRIHAGDQNLVENLYQGLVASENPGNYTTVICHDTGALFDANAFAKEIEKYPDLKPRYATYTDAIICPVWSAGQADATETAPVQSDIPTLILNGSEFDSATPPSYAQLAADTLSNSHLFIFTKYTHSVSFEECPKSMLTAFLDDPSRSPDSACIAQMDGLPFITDVYPNKGAIALFISVQNPTSPASLGIGFIGLIFLLGFILLPIVYFRSKGQTAQTPPALARLTLWLASTLNLIFMVGAWILSKKALADNYGWSTLVGFSPSSSKYLFLLPWLTSLLTVALFIFAFLAWKNRWWKRLELVLFSLGTLAAVSFAGILIYMKVLSM